MVECKKSKREYNQYVQSCHLRTQTLREERTHQRDHHGSARSLVARSWPIALLSETGASTQATARAHLQGKKTATCHLPRRDRRAQVDTSKLYLLEVNDRIHWKEQVHPSHQCPQPLESLADQAAGPTTWGRQDRSLDRPRVRAMRRMVSRKAQFSLQGLALRWEEHSPHHSATVRIDNLTACLR